MRTVAFLAWSRLRHRPARWLLIAAGVAVATVLPVLSASSAHLVAAAAPAHSLAELPAGERSVIVTYSGVSVPDADLAAIDGAVRTRLADLSAAAPRAQLLFRRLADPSGAPFALGAADDLGSAVRLTAGRAPATCTPARCEVVVVGAGDPALDPALGVVIVGHAERADPLLLTGTFEPGRDVPLLLADRVAAASRLAALDSFPRAYGWVAPVDLDLVTRLGVSGYLARSARVGEQLSATRAGITVTAPDTTLRAAGDRAGRSSRRFSLLGGAATALLLGFAVIGAIGTRRDHAAVRALLRRRGASRSALATLTAVESAVPVLVGTVAGLALGA
ncbi:hypothetical protein, partial [Luedemannella flava]|uniref:hypothetical protein n=1 Tax=Luedemannella flava TaxID=349316 RepID=UPI0031D4C644